jgi:hypothetical protein
LILIGNAFNLVSVLLAGLVLNATTRWWWIDSVGSLAIVPPAHLRRLGIGIGALIDIKRETKQAGRIAAARLTSVVASISSHRTRS